MHKITIEWDPRLPERVEWTYNRMPQGTNVPAIPVRVCSGYGETLSSAFVAAGHAALKHIHTEEVYAREAAAVVEQITGKNVVPFPQMELPIIDAEFNEVVRPGAAKPDTQS